MMEPFILDTPREIKIKCVSCKEWYKADGNDKLPTCNKTECNQKAFKIGYRTTVGTDLYGNEAFGYYLISQNEGSLK